MIKEKCLFVDLYTGKVSTITTEEFDEMIQGCEVVSTQAGVTYKSEEYFVITYN